MLVSVDIRVTELLCARVCHELASPIGAINNGIEMIEEFDDSMLPEALPLIGTSAKIAASRLNFYRMAYGGAGTNSIGSFSDLKELADAIFQESRITMRWPADGIVPEFEDGCGKMLLNLFPLAAETLPRGGVLSVAVDDAGGGLRMIVSAEGEGPRISEELGLAMAPDAAIDTLTPRNIHAYFTTQLASRLDTRIDVDEGTEGRIAFSVILTRTRA